MLEPAHIRMARAALGWRLSDLAERAEVNLNTVSRFEAGREIMTGTLARFEKVLTDAGVTFLFEEGGQGIGVRLARPTPSQDAKSPRKGTGLRRTAER